jgi:hypothetical protein
MSYLGGNNDHLCQLKSFELLFAKCPDRPKFENDWDTEDSIRKMIAGKSSLVNLLLQQRSAF